MLKYLNRKGGMGPIMIKGLDLRMQYSIRQRLCEIEC